MRYNIPQFIDTEDKVIGPLTVKQFLWLLAGGVGCFIIWQFAGSIGVFVVFAAPIAGFSALLAFWKINGKPFIMIVTSFFKFFMNPKNIFGENNTIHIAAAKQTPIFSPFKKGD